MTGVNKIRIVVSFLLHIGNGNAGFDFISVLPAFNQDLKPAHVSFMKALRIIVCTSNIISLFQLNHIRADINITTERIHTFGIFRIKTLNG